LESIEGNWRELTGQVKSKFARLCVKFA